MLFAQSHRTAWYRSHVSCRVCVVLLSSFFDWKRYSTSTASMDSTSENDVQTPDDANEIDRERTEQDPEKRVTCAESTSRSPDTCKTKDKDEPRKQEDLFSKFQSTIGQQLCFSERPQQFTHISSLPSELIMHILRWILWSDQYELKTLDQCAAVCRGWYLCARDPVMLHQACSQMWHDNINYLENYGGSWRRMLIERPRVLTLGCYIIAIQNSANNQCYYYLRFFSDRQFVHLASYNCPDTMAQRFHRKEDIPQDAVWGHFSYSDDDQISLHFSVQPNWYYENFYDFALKNINIMDLKIMDYNSKRNWQLKCFKFHVTFENHTSINIFTQKLPAFIYLNF